MPYADAAIRGEYQRQWVAARRADWFAGKTCAWCGSADDLQLDHVDAATKVSHRIWSWARERREAELAKCRPLCRPCHQKKTDAQGENPSKLIALRHGSRSMYQKHKCRCDECRAWNSARRRSERGSLVKSESRAVEAR